MTGVLNATGAPSGGSDCTELMRLATLGALVGGSLAAARRFQQVQQGEQPPLTAVLETGRTAVVSGIATAVAGAVASSLTEQGVLRLGIMFLAGSTVLYGLQHQLTLEEADD